MGNIVREQKKSYRGFAAGLLILLFSPSLAVMAFGGPYEDGIAAYKRGDYKTTVRLFRPLAEKGDAKTQLLLGDMYYLGEGVPKNYANAAKWYRKAAERGKAKAQLYLGEMYASGKGIRKNYVLAYKWFHIAASRFPSTEEQLREKAAKGRDLVASKMTPAQIARAQRLAGEWKLRKVGE